MIILYIPDIVATAEIQEVVAYIQEAPASIALAHSRQFKFCTTVYKYKTSRPLDKKRAQFNAPAMSLPILCRVPRQLDSTYG